MTAPLPGGQPAGGPLGEHCAQPPQQAAQRGHLHSGPVSADGPRLPHAHAAGGDPLLPGADP